MKIAYLILAHNNYRHLQRLIDTLQYPDVTFYIHIDKKSEMPQLRGDNIHFVKRVKVYWSQFGEAQAALNLLQDAYKSNNDRYILLSGMDYPIKSNDRIYNTLNNDKEFMWMIEYEKGVHALSFITSYHFNNIQRRRNNKSFKNILLLFIEKIIKRTGFKKKVPFQIYTGSQWFALTKDCVSYIIKESENKKYNILKTSRFPSENFFTTIVAHSQFKNNLSHDLTYADCIDQFRAEVITKNSILNNLL